MTEKKHHENEKDLTSVVLAKRLLYKQDNDDEIKKVRDYFDNHFSIILIGGKVVIWNKQSFSNNAMSVDSAREFFANKTYTIKKISVNGVESTEERNSFNDWFNHEETKRFESITFRPDKPFGDIGTEFNTWRGWAVESKQGECGLYLRLIEEVICDGDKELAEYLLDWMAQLIQDPCRKTFHAIAIKGEQGTGKSFFILAFLKLFGVAGLELNNAEILTTNFNSPLANKLLVYGDEALWSGDKKSRGQLKNIISSYTINITYKGRDTISLPNYMRFIFSTNSDWSAPVEKGNRRWVSIRCSNKHKQDRKYFSEIQKELDDGGYEALLNFLQHRDISKRDWSNIPETDAGKEDLAQTTVNDNLIAEYIDFCLDGMEENNFMHWYCDNAIQCGKFISLLESYCKSRGHKYTLSKITIGLKLKEIFGADFSAKPNWDKSTKRNNKVYEFGSRKEIEEAIDKYYLREPEEVAQ